MKTKPPFNMGNASGTLYSPGYQFQTTAQNDCTEKNGWVFVEKSLLDEFDDELELYKEVCQLLSGDGQMWVGSVSKYHPFQHKK